jgi:hypothetical protein
MVYVPFGPVNKATGSAYRDKTETGAAHLSSVSTQGKVLDATLQNLDMNYNQAVQNNKGVPTTEIVQAALDTLSGLSGTPGYADPTFQSKILNAQNKYMGNLTKVQYGAPNTIAKDQDITSVQNDLESSVGKDGYISPDTAKKIVDNWRQANPLYKVSEITSYIKPYLDPLNPNYPSEIKAPKGILSRVLDQVLDSLSHISF